MQIPRATADSPPLPPPVTPASAIQPMHPAPVSEHRKPNSRPVLIARLDGADSKLNTSAPTTNSESEPDALVRIYGARLFDPESLAFVPHPVVTVHPASGLIVDVHTYDPAGIYIAADANTVDLREKTLLPGFVDAHVHSGQREDKVLTRASVFLHPYSETPWDDQLTKEHLAERTVRATVHARRTLQAGFTTVRGAGDADIALRACLSGRDALIPGPRYFCANRAIVATGSYGPRSGVNLGVEGVDGVTGAEVADGVDGCVRAVRRQIGAGADWIKLGPSGCFFEQTLTRTSDPNACCATPAVRHRCFNPNLPRAPACARSHVQFYAGMYVSCRGTCCEGSDSEAFITVPYHPITNLRYPPPCSAAHNLRTVVIMHMCGHQTTASAPARSRQTQPRPAPPSARSLRPRQTRSSAPRTSTGVRVAAHASHRDTIATIARQGVDTVEHGFDLAATASAHATAGKTIKALLGDAVWVPTLSAFYTSGANWERAAATFRAALAEGLDAIAVGGDTGVFAHGDNALEMRLMVQLGADWRRVLRWATLGGWRAVRSVAWEGPQGLARVERVGEMREDRRVVGDNEVPFGVIKRGWAADIVASAGDLEGNFEGAVGRDSIVFVMKAGKVYKKDGKEVVDP
ncbi:hypothetical protein EVG20_g4682 [Dentipellis fragilis]|uniref:Amidohydrolase-related domain-containing protein n=1 Tax=Dentipellis fragilis TaxID=205917 RepID=A0A4Y9YUZ8_9AGAM|nr:hypothetical protein EVG20_g4682 [Dentipellis fragilis]